LFSPPVASTLVDRCVALRDPQIRISQEQDQMASDKRVKVTLECTECKRRNYITKKSKVNDRERIELKKYCRFDHKHTLHKETR
jgi:large subunit ribosomal protein L33